MYVIVLDKSIHKYLCIVNSKMALFHCHFLFMYVQFIIILNLFYVPICALLVFICALYRVGKWGCTLSVGL